MSSNYEEYEDSFEEILNENPEEEKGISGFFRKNSSVFMISVALHLVALLVVSLITFRDDPPPEITMIETIYVEEEEPPVVVEVDPIEIDPTEVKFDEEVVTEKVTELEPEPKIEVTEVEDNQENDPDVMPSEISPELVQALPAILGRAIPVTVSKAPASGYGNRVGDGFNQTIIGCGVPQSALDAVEEALKWLAHHQEADGSWHADKYEGTDAEHFNATALALLPFYGKGYSENTGKYKKTIRKGVRMLNKLVVEKVKNQAAPRPHFGRNYGSAIGLMALSEASAFGSSAMTKKNADLIAKMFVEMHSKTPSGWHYQGGGDDFSVSGWIALGLKSAKDAQLKSMRTKDAKTVFANYRTWVDETMTSYEDGMGKYRPGKAGNRNMTWVGMFQKQFLGFKRNDPFLTAAADLSVRKGWIDQVLTGDEITDSYAIYYGTLAAFQQKGKMWNSWKGKMEDYLVRTQLKGDPKLLGGSWNPGKDHTSKHGGRVMVTALMALSLEVYYRYAEMM